MREELQTVSATLYPHVTPPLLFDLLIGSMKQRGCRGGGAFTDLPQQPADLNFGGISIFCGCLASQIYPSPVKRTGVHYLNISPSDLAEVRLRPEVQYPGK